MDLDLDSKKNVNDPKSFLKKINKRASFTIIIIALIIISVIAAYKLLKEYVWMDTVGFESVFTTILYGKISLGVIGLLCFGFLSFITVYLLLRSYMSHFHRGYLPTFIS